MNNVRQMVKLKNYILLIYRPANGIGIGFGTCMPAVCSLHLLEPIINNKLLQNFTKVSVTFPKNTCQIEEIASDYRTIDIVTMWVMIITRKFVYSPKSFSFFLSITHFSMILALILFLIVASTSYDVICTIKDRKWK